MRVLSRMWSILTGLVILAALSAPAHASSWLNSWYDYANPPPSSSLQGVPSAVDGGSTGGYHTNVYYISSAGNLIRYKQYWSSGSSYTDLGNPGYTLAQSPGCIRRVGYSVDHCFVIGAGKLFYAFGNTPSWTDLSRPSTTYVITAPTATANTYTSILDVFVVALDGNMWWRSYTGSSWSSWTNLGKPSGTLFVNSPACVAEKTYGDIYCYVKAFDGNVYTKSYNGSSWSSWSSIGKPASATLSGNVTAATNYGYHRVLATDTSGYLYLYSSGSWSQQTHSGGGNINVETGIGCNYSQVTAYNTYLTCFDSRTVSSALHPHLLWNTTL